MNGEAAAAAKRVRFGEFEFDLRSGELSEGPTKMLLQEQPRRVLVALLAHAGEMVTRGLLQKLLWPAGTHVDFDLGLNAAVRRLRILLRDTADRPRFIETLPRRGYRFIAPVEPACQSRDAGWHSVLVLPFDAGGDSADRLLADQVTEDVVTQVSKVHGLLVVSSALLAEWKTADASLRQMAGDFGVSVVVEGSARRTDGRVRITSRLVDARTGRQLWAEAFEWAVAEIAVAQTEVSLRIAAALQACVRCASSPLSEQPAPPRPSEEALPLIVEPPPLSAQRVPGADEVPLDQLKPA